MVDTGSPSDTLTALDFAKNQMGVKPENIKLIVLTHLHLDHVAGLSVAAKHTGASIAIGEWAKPYLTDNQKVSMPPFGQWLCELIPSWAKEGLPLPNLFDFKNSLIAGFPFIANRLLPPATIWLKESDCLPYLNEWKVFYTPGHTSDSICLFHHQQGILIAGDLILNFFGSGEFTKIVSDEAAMERSISSVCELDLKGLLPGHGYPLWGNNLAPQITRRSQWGFCAKFFMPTQSNGPSRE